MAPGRLGNPNSPWWIRFLLVVYEWAASLQAAVILIGLTAGVLAWATFVEKRYGTEAVWFGIYGAWWFMGLVVLLGLNVLCATLIRWPWKKHQAGFVVTHTGILVLLAGCLVQQGWGLQGQMILHEGEASNVVYENQKVFRLEIVEGNRITDPARVKTIEVPFRSGPFHWADYQRVGFFPWRIVPRDRGVIYEQDGIRLEVLDYYADSERLMVPRVVLGLRRLGEFGRKGEGFGAGWGRLVLRVVPARGGHAAQRPFGVGDRQQMPWGPPVVFWLAGSQEECQAFLATGPEGPVGTQGQVVLWHRGKVYRFAMERLGNRAEADLGDSGLKVRLIRYEERFRAVELEISSSSGGADRIKEQMFLFAQNPSHNRYAESLGVYGSFWVEPPELPSRLIGIERVELLRLAACLRLDLLVGPDGSLYYRQWYAPRVISGGRWPGMESPPVRAVGKAFPQPRAARAEAGSCPSLFSGEAPQQATDAGKPGQPYPVADLGPLRVFANTPMETEIHLMEFRPSPRPLILYEPKPLEGAGRGRLPQPRAKIRLTVWEKFSSPAQPPAHPSGTQPSRTASGPEPEANVGEFWIPLGGPRFAEEEAIVCCGNRRVWVQLDYRKQQLGIKIHLRDFTRKMDPGSPHESHYSSLVDVWEGLQEPKLRHQKVLITMNQPLTTKDPLTGRTYRFYQSGFTYLGKPGDPEFDQWFQERAFRFQQASGPETPAPRPPEQKPDSASIPENLYRSILSVNYDPGRGLKYAGSLLIVAGIGWMYWMRAYIFSPSAWRRIAQGHFGLGGWVLAVFGWMLLGAGPVEAEELDWSQWRRLPVFAGGRLMPLDSFARSVVEEICGRSHPWLSLADSLPGQDLRGAEYAEAWKLFPEGKGRRWTPYELIFSWLVEPQRWHRVPFLVGEHHQLREELLGLPREDASGRPIRYVSPWQLEHADRFWQWQADLQPRRQEAEAAGQTFQPTGLDRKAWQLLEAYTAWRRLVFSAEDLGSPQSLFRTRLVELRETWWATAEAMEQALEMAELHGQLAPGHQAGAVPPDWPPPQPKPPNPPGPLWSPPRQAYQKFQEAMASLQNLAEQRPIPRQQMEHQAHQLRLAGKELADWFEYFYQGLRQSSSPLRPELRRQMQTHWMGLVSRTRQLYRLAWEVQTALFDDCPVGGGTGEMLRLVPSLNPFALEEARTPEENPQPWLTWQALMEASVAETLGEYPAAEIQAVRRALAEVAQVYQDRQLPDRAQRFAAAMRRFTEAVGQLGQAINPRRAKLPVRNLDEAALRATQYPPPGATDLEVHYNQLDPFRAAWIGYLAAVGAFGLAFGRLRTLMFWIGMGLSALGQFFILYGLGLRYAITGWVPLTNMFETVVFVALSVGLMGWILAVWPILGPGLRVAWQLTAWPLPEALWGAIAGRSGNLSAKSSPESGSGSGKAGGTSFPAPESSGLAPGQQGPGSAGASGALGWSVRAGKLWRCILAPIRLLLMGLVFYGLTQLHYGEGEGYTVVSLLPRVERTGALTANDLVSWLVGWAFLLGSMWYAPRVLLAALSAVWTVPAGWRGHNLPAALAQVLGRKVFAFSGAVMGLLGALLAYYAPPTVLDRSIGPLRPVLRDNFWLTAHVLTITASYGAGALALALGNLSLLHYLFGRYRPVGIRPPAHSDEHSLPTPPEALPHQVPGPQPEAPSTQPGHPPGAEGLFSVGEPTRPSRLRREPSACASLAQYIYRSMQVAVLLLAAGTLLGALWADVAWGRFWGWDAKEVWSLISLLVYMVVLHGRYIGWFGNFGMAAFAVIGATSILMAWYGVNYVLDVGLHTYGRGTGGLSVVLAVVAANWLLLGAARLRYWLENQKNPKIS